MCKAVVIVLVVADSLYDGSVMALLLKSKINSSMLKCLGTIQSKMASVRWKWCGVLSWKRPKNNKGIKCQTICSPIHSYSMQLSELCLGVENKEELHLYLSRELIKYVAAHVANKELVASNGTIMQTAS